MGAATILVDSLESTVAVREVISMERNRNRRPRTGLYISEEALRILLLGLLISLRLMG